MNAKRRLLGFFFAAPRDVWTHLPRLHIVFVSWSNRNSNFYILFVAHKISSWRSSKTPHIYACSVDAEADDKWYATVLAMSPFIFCNRTLFFILKLSAYLILNSLYISKNIIILCFFDITGTKYPETRVCHGEKINAWRCECSASLLEFFRFFHLRQHIPSKKASSRALGARNACGSMHYMYVLLSSHSCGDLYILLKLEMKIPILWFPIPIHGIQAVNRCDLNEDQFLQAVLQRGLYTLISRDRYYANINFYWYTHQLAWCLIGLMNFNYVQQLKLRSTYPS